MKQLIETLQTLLCSAATNIEFDSPPKSLETNTFGVITAKPVNNSCENLYLYLRKNVFGLLTDIECVGTSNLLKDDLAISLIKPSSFLTEEDLEYRVSEALISIFSILETNYKNYVIESAQLNLFPEENRFLVDHDFSNRLN